MVDIVRALWADSPTMRRETSPDGGITADEVAAERIAQGLPPTLTDPELLAMLASFLRSPRVNRPAA